MNATARTRQEHYPGPHLPDRRETHQVDQADRRKYRTEIPNAVDDMDLSVYAFRLYVHIKRVAGDSGQCWEGTRTMAAACKMSKSAVSRAKQELVDAGLIELELGAWEKGKSDTIAIIDLWDENYRKYTPEPVPVGDTPVPDRNRPVPTRDAPVPVVGHKKEPYKKEPYKKDDDDPREPQPDAVSEKTDLDPKQDRHPAHDFFAQRFGEAVGKERLALDAVATMTDNQQLIFDIIEDIHQRTLRGSQIAFPAAYIRSTLVTTLAAGSQHRNDQQKSSNYKRHGGHSNGTGRSKNYREGWTPADATVLDEPEQLTDTEWDELERSLRELESKSTRDRP